MIKVRIGIISAVFAILISVSSASYANSKYASLVIDADTGVVLHQENAGKVRYPASLVKMMTLYLTFQALESGKLSMDQKIRVSAHAAGQPPSKLGLRSGQYIKVRDAILAITIKSANDAAVVLAEAVGGSEWQFANLSNKMAKKLGMNNTTYRNASGLHDRKQKTTAYDVARLAVALRRDYPRFYHLFDRTQFYFNGKLYRSHNRVSMSYRGADGLKTGYIRASGFNLATSARRSGRSVVGVVLGGRSTKSRDRHMTKLLDQSFYKMAMGNSTGAVMQTASTPTPHLKPRNKSQANFSSDAPKPLLKPTASLPMLIASN